MKRRDFLAALSVLPASRVLAARPGSPGAMPTEQDIKPYREVATVERYVTRKLNLAFIAFDCPVSRTFFSAIKRWGDTLPPPWKLQIVPAITQDLGSVVANRTWRTVSTLPGANSAAFATALFDLVQGQGLALDNPATYRQALRAAGVNAKAFGVAFQKFERADFRDAVDAMMTFKVDAVPSLAIGGRFVITPDQTGENPEQFIGLANAMMSGVLRGMI